MRNHLYVDGVDLATFGVYISGQGAFSAPAKEIAQYDVPGHDGTVIGKSSRLLNLEVTYPAFMYSNFKTNLRNLRSFLLSRAGYVEIRDTYNTDEFRLGMYLGAFEPDVVSKNNAGRFDLTFDCKPQRYLLTGQTPITFNNILGDQDLTNPTYFTARPFFRVYGDGIFTVKNSAENVAVEVEDAGTPYVDIDCETMQAYYNDTNLNTFVSFYDWQTSGYIDAPTLTPGTNKINILQSTSGGISKVEITPRWWMV